MTGALRRGRSDRSREGHVTTEAEWTDATTSKEAPGAGRGRKDAFLAPLVGSAALLMPPISDFWPPEWQENAFLLFFKLPNV